MDKEQNAALRCGGNPYQMIHPAWNRCTPGALLLKRVAGIEPATKAWEAFVLPLNYTRMAIRALNQGRRAANTWLQLADRKLESYYTA